MAHVSRFGVLAVAAFGAFVAAVVTSAGAKAASCGADCRRPLRGARPVCAEMPRPSVPVPTVVGRALRWSDVAPLLADACVRCHGGPADAAPCGVRYDTYAAAVEAGPRPSVRPGRPDESPLLLCLAPDAKDRMPADGPPYLSPAAVDLLRRWVADGARGDDGLPAPDPTAPRAAARAPAAPR